MPESHIWRILEHSMLSSFGTISLTLLFQNYLALCMFQLLARIAADGKPQGKDVLAPWRRIMPVIRKRNTIVNCDIVRNVR